MPSESVNKAVTVLKPEEKESLKQYIARSGKTSVR
jgi:hypothetical protein